jgi:hypothetical protein
MQLTFALDDIANVNNGSIKTNATKFTWVPKPKKPKKHWELPFRKHINMHKQLEKDKMKLSKSSNYKNIDEGAYIFSYKNV